MSQARYRSNVGERHQRIGRGLDENELSIASDGFFHCSQVGRVHISELQAKIGEDLIEEPGHAAINIVSAYNVVA